MFDSLPDNPAEALDWTLDRYTPYFEDLIAREVAADTLDSWLADWSKLSKVAYEVGARLYVANTCNTTDEKGEARLTYFYETLEPAFNRYINQLNQKLLATGIIPDGMDVPLRNIRATAEIFREENLPLIGEDKKLGIEYDKIAGAQTVEWDGKEVTLPQLTPVYHDLDRDRREKAWRLAHGRVLEDRSKLNDLWAKFVTVRSQIARNAGYDNFRDYQWKRMNRHDYTPQDNETFLDAIEEVGVPAAERIYARMKQRLGVDSLRPWDIGGEPGRTGVDVLGREPLKPFDDVDDLISTTETIFRKVDPALGDYFKVMIDEDLLDLDNRKGKAPGGYCIDYPVVRRPFIFMNAVGIHDDVQTLLHEGGHAFHAFEVTKLPLHQQQDVPLEFAEVASMAMELIAAPYLTTDQGGFYTEADAARARVEHLESMIRFWPYMAVVDSFQHWAYANPEQSVQADACDAKWSELWGRFIKGIDYTGLEDIKATGWHRKLHIFQVPFYYVEYGLAQLGAAQVWANAIKDQAQAVRQYRAALALGMKATLPDLFQTAGAKFGFDANTLGSAIQLAEKTIRELDPA